MKRLILVITLSLTGACWAADNADKTEIVPYGYVKVDLAYDNALSSHGNFIMFAKPHPQGQTTHTLNFTARQTRLRLNLIRGRTKGRLEVDFYGGGQENKNHLMLRKAYVDIPLGPINMHAGQTSDIISPLVPSTLNYTVGWGAGNIGYRRPQIQISSDIERFDWAVGIARSIGNDLNGDTVIDGDAAAIPTAQGRLGVQLPNTAFGISAHYGLMDAPGAADDTYCTWSLNADLKVSLGPSLSVLAESYMGVNTGVYFGAILNGDCAHDLKSRGGWLNIQYNPALPWALSFGGGIDDLDNEHRTYINTASDARTRNAFVFGNLTYTLQSNVKTGVEISGWQTHYLNPSPANSVKAQNIRLQWSIQTTF